MTLVSYDKNGPQTTLTSNQDSTDRKTPSLKSNNASMNDEPDLKFDNVKTPNL